MAPKGKGVASYSKFVWNDGLMRKFIDVCLDYQSTNGIDQPFSWVDIAVKFGEKVGVKFEKENAKNKFDHMKKVWKEWKELKHGETGLGWDTAKGTITQSSDWWDLKIKENLDVKKFRKKGVAPEIEEKWDQLFGSIVATGQHCVAPTMDLNEQRINNNDDDDYESHSDDVFDNLYGIDLDQTDPAVLQNIMREVTSSKDNKSKKSKSSGSLIAEKPKKRQSAGSVLYNTHLGIVGEASQKMMAYLDADVASSDVVGKHTLEEAMDVVDRLVVGGDLTEGDMLWCFCVNELGKHEARELFLTLRNDSGRVAWLKYRFSMRSARE